MEIQAQIQEWNFNKTSMVSTVKLQLNVNGLYSETSTKRQWLVQWNFN